ncbi:MAG: hypothetical protein FJZ00_07805 [Candidatus Sericytochromatia bacterium]|uniref:Uncharacterized protein n=1 Tax=Candidatus Tanganyikabacteria bacterium TaxID=2961651 RepID=A0A938BJ69_9BACT|nr:hypothetical protein [Candidatus Tanganyikabacteria bacterium]
MTDQEAVHQAAIVRELRARNQALRIALIQAAYILHGAHSSRDLDSCERDLCRKWAAALGAHGAPEVG